MGAYSRRERGAPHAGIGAGVIQIEFYGVARRMAGRSSLTVETDAGGSTSLGAVLRLAASCEPALAPECIDGETLGETFIANVDGNRFVRDPGTTLHSGQTVMIFSADAGG